LDELNQSELHWVETIGRSDTCANCGVPKAGVFCSECGQKHITARLKFGELFFQLIAKLTNWDRGLAYTFWMLLIRPGTVARDYVVGKQRPYIGPLAYFFLGAALQLVTLWIVEPQLRLMMTQSVRMEPGQLPPPGIQRLEEILGEDFASAFASTYITTLQQGYSYVALLFFCIPFAFFLKFLHGFVGERFRFGEAMVFALYSVGQMLVVTAVLTPIALRIGAGVQAAVGPLVYIAVAMRARSGFMRAAWSSRVMTFLALLFSAMFFFIAIMVTLIGSFVVRVVFAAQANARVLNSRAPTDVQAQPI
jgi:hypothetical protein